MEIREVLLNKGAKIIAPCMHEKKCMLPENDWCHAICRIPRSRLHKHIKEASVPYEDEKFSYMAFLKQECFETENSKLEAKTIEFGMAENRVLRHPKIEPRKNNNKCMYKR